MLGRAAGSGDGTGPRADLEERAVRRAALFDERNGTPHQGGRVRGVLAAEPVVDFLALSPAGGSADAHLADGRPLDAAEAAEEVLDATADHAARRRAWTVLARAQKRLGEDAAATFAALAEEAARLRDGIAAARE